MCVYVCLFMEKMEHVNSKTGNWSGYTKNTGHKNFSHQIVLALSLIAQLPLTAQSSTSSCCSLSVFTHKSQQKNAIYMSASSTAIS